MPPPKCRLWLRGNLMPKHVHTGSDDIALTAVNVANMGSNLIPRLGGPLGVGLSALGSDLEAEREEKQIARKFGTRHLGSMQYIPAMRAKLGELRSRWKEGAVTAGTGLAGTMVAMGVAGAALGPIAWIPSLVIGGAGAIAGGYAGSKAYRRLAGQIQDTVAIVSQIREAQKNDEAIPEEVVFAALASKLRGKDAKEAGALLYQKTGTRYFHEAVEQGKLEGLAEMMKDPDMQRRGIERKLRRLTNMPMDLSNINKSVVTQYAEYLNSGRMDAKYLLRQFSPLDIKPVVMAYGAPSAEISAPANIPSRLQDSHSANL